MSQTEHFLWPLLMQAPELPKLNRGIPQGSVLSTLLFSILSTHPISIRSILWVACNCYVDPAAIQQPQHKAFENLVTLNQNEGKIQPPWLIPSLVHLPKMLTKTELFLIPISVSWGHALSFLALIIAILCWSSQLKSNVGVLTIFFFTRRVIDGFNWKTWK